MEDLNKHQLILLTLLVSFVTSIATGIITYTLLQEAPIAVTQNINRVVERTIEKVVPEEGGKEIIREVQVVKEEDLVLQSIEKNANSVVRVKTIGDGGVELLAGLGFVVADEVMVMNEKYYSAGLNYTISFNGGKSYSVSKIYNENGLVFMKIGKPANEKYTFYLATFGNSDSLKLGQTIVSISGKTGNTVAIGRVSEILNSTENKSMTEIITDLSTSKSSLGSVLLNLNGEVVGLESKNIEENDTLTYIPANNIKILLKTALIELAK